MNKFIAEIDLKNLSKDIDEKYQLSIKLLWINKLFIFDNEEKNKDRMFFTADNGFSIYSYSFGKIFKQELEQNYRLRLPDTFFYNEKNVNDNIVTIAFAKDIERYEYLKALKYCLEEWAYKWEGFKEVNEKYNIGFKEVIMNNKWWVI